MGAVWQWRARICMGMLYDTTVDLSRNRSRALQREKRTRLERELAKIDPQEEKQLAEEGLGERVWPEY